MLANGEPDNGRLYSRLHKTWCFPTCFFGCNLLFTPCRRAVSRSKRRYEQDGFDLDLTRITPRIIVHGFPAVGLEHIYRNPRGEIRRFMDTFHKDHYKVYNFCCEYGRGYDPSVFYGRVKRYPFKDHNTPPLTTMVNFANDAKAWLDADKENVVNMHCKAGECPSAKAAMDLYDRTRVNNNKGLTVTSQRKYVIFFERLFREFWGVSGNIGDVPADAPLVVPEEPEVQIVGVEVLNGNAGALKALSVHLYQGTNLTPTHLDSADATSDQQFTFTVNARVKGNFKVRVDTKKGIHKKKVFEFWHNTLFLKQGETVIDFAPEEIDIKRKGLKKYGEKITLRLRFNWNGGASAVPVSHEAIELVKKDEAL